MEIIKRLDVPRVDEKLLEDDDNKLTFYVDDEGMIIEPSSDMTVTRGFLSHKLQNMVSAKGILLIAGEGVRVYRWIEMSENGDSKRDKDVVCNRYDGWIVVCERGSSIGRVSKAMNMEGIFGNPFYIKQGNGYARLTKWNICKYFNVKRENIIDVVEFCEVGIRQFDIQYNAELNRLLSVLRKVSYFPGKVLVDTVDERIQFGIPVMFSGKESVFSVGYGGGIWIHQYIVISPDTMGFYEKKIVEGPELDKGSSPNFKGETDPYIAIDIIDSILKHGRPPTLQVFESEEEYDKYVARGKTPGDVKREKDNNESDLKNRVD